MTLLVIGHGGFLWYLGNKREGPHTRQQWVTTISTTFVWAIRGLAVLGFGMVVETVAWEVMRKHSLTFEELQVVAKLPSLPPSLRYLRLAKLSPTITLAVCLIIMIPLVMTWVPAALVIEYRLYESTANTSVSWNDPNFRGENDTSFRGIVVNSRCQIEYNDGCK
jgi:hypothetical protein